MTTVTKNRKNWGFVGPPPRWPAGTLKVGGVV
jgi:hypothetical protein